MSQRATLRNLTKGVQRDIDRAIRDESTRLQQTTRKQECERARSAKQRQKAAAAFQSRFDLGMKGLGVLLDFLQSPDVQELISIKIARNRASRAGETWMHEGFTFYAAYRPGAGESLYLVEFTASEKVLWITHGLSADESPDELCISYDLSEDEQRKEIETLVREEKEDSLAACRSRDGKWNPEALVFQVLVDCGSATKFRKLLKEALRSPEFASSKKKKKQ